MATEQAAAISADETRTAIEASATSMRYHALDRVRAVAMLLGVVYHSILFRMFAGGGGPPGPMGASDGSRWFSDWLHSFRMPLFFLISGFFGRMMLQKYGTLGYLRKRWQRIAVPLFVGIFTFSPLYILAREAVGGPGPMPFGGGPGGPPPGAPGPDGSSSALRRGCRGHSALRRGCRGHSALRRASTVPADFVLLRAGPCRGHSAVGRFA